MRNNQRRYVRQMPKIYGNLQPRTRSFAGLWIVLRTLLGVALVGGIGYLIFFGPIFRVRNVQVEGAVLSSTDDISSLIPKGQSLWTISERKIIAGALQNPLVLSAAVYRGIPSSIKVVVEEREPALLWYSGTTVTLVDADGDAFLQYPANNLPASDTPAGKMLAQLPKVYDTKSLPVHLNQQIAGTTFVAFVTKAQQDLHQYLPSLTWDRSEITDTTYDVTFISKQGLRVVMDSLADAGVQSRNLQRLVAQKKATLTSTVDLRIDRWAYVR